MPRLVMVAFLTVALTSKAAIVDANTPSQAASCPGLPVGQFESRFPAKAKRLTFNNAMLETFVELWKAGSRPDLPRRPERIVIYSLPGLPLIIGYQEGHCIIAYLAVNSADLWRWLHRHLGWNV